MERDTGSDTEIYMVTPPVQHLVSEELRQARLYTAITKRGTVFLWPIKLPGDDNERIRRISDTAIQCAEQAKTLWVKMHWDRDLGGYAMQRAKGDLGEPQWPDKSMRDLLEIGVPQLSGRPPRSIRRFSGIRGRDMKARTSTVLETLAQVDQWETTKRFAVPPRRPVRQVRGAGGSAAHSPVPVVGRSSTRLAQTASGLLSSSRIRRANPLWRAVVRKRL